MNILFGGLILASGLSFATDKDIPASAVPSVVINQFNSDFPKASDIDWEVKNEIFKVDFQLGWFKDYEVWYAADGAQIKINEECTKSELPQSVLTSLDKNFRGYRVEDVDKITEKGSVTYKVEVERGEDERTIFFNENGELKK
ncbi:MAG: PepSY-like domain-containing protein [Mangrovibacterium sp.]